MKQYDPNIHHRRSIRLKGYDYSQMGVYFITICCQDRTCLFGDVVDGEMVLNEYGRIALEEWIKTTTIRPNVELREFVIMPNHIHAIIRFIGEGECNSPNGKVELRTPENLTDAFNTPQPSSCTCLNDQRRGESHSPNENENLCAPIETGECNSNQQTGECNSPLRGPSQTVGAVVRGYKSAVTKKLNELGIGCSVWQRNYYEHIIRNEQSYINIAEYIIKNPAKWQEDRFYRG